MDFKKTIRNAGFAVKGIFMTPTPAEQVSQRLTDAAIPVSDDPCRGCADPCDVGHLEYPPRFDVDHTSDMLGSCKPYNRQASRPLSFPAMINCNVGYYIDWKIRLGKRSYRSRRNVGCISFNGTAQAATKLIRGPSQVINIRPSPPSCVSSRCIRQRRNAASQHHQWLAQHTLGSRKRNMHRTS